jgi:nitrogen fixation protein NifU and related proteins
LPRSESQLYRDIVLDHARRPRNAGRLPHPDRHALVVNPLCGDELCVDLALENETTITEARFLVRGCAISTAAASMLSEQIIGLTLDEVARLERQWLDALNGTEAELPEELEALTPLLAVRAFPHRHSCARLPWDALRASMSLSNQDG